MSLVSTRNSNPYRFFFLSIAACVLAILASGCQIHRVDVLQGHESAIEDAENLIVGMTRDEVADIMGTALVIDKFRENRWDYLYSETTDDGQLSLKKRVTLMFEDDLLVDVIKIEYSAEESE